MNDAAVRYKLFENKGERYLYFCENGKICKIDDAPETYELKQNKFPKNLTPINCKDRNFADVCKSLKYAEIAREMEQIGKYSRSDEIKISLLLIQSCNLRCTYCYADHGQYYDTGVMEEDTAVSIIQQLVEKGQYKKIFVSFFGGEALLNFSLIKNIVRYCERLQDNSQVRFAFDMTTNGTLLNQEMEKFIIKHKIQVMISIDGDAAGNDLCRVDEYGKGSYDRILEKTKSLRERGMLLARATVTPGNMEFADIYDHLYHLNFKHIALTPAFNMFSPDEYKKLTEKHLDWLSRLEEHIREKDYDYVLKNGNLTDDFYKLDRDIVRKISCGAARTNAAFDIHGKRYPCHRFVAFKEFGSATMEEAEAANKNLWHEVFQKQESACRDCWALNMCVSGCICDNYTYGGTLTSIRDYYCEYYKAVTEKEISMYIALTEEERKLLCRRESRVKKKVAEQQ